MPWPAPDRRLGTPIDPVFESKKIHDRPPARDHARGRDRTLVCPSRPGLGDLFERLRDEQAAKGLVGRSREEIDASVDALRDELEMRMGEIERLQDECRQTWGNPA
jgi:hypothetical protein